MEYNQKPDFPIALLLFFTFIEAFDAVGSRVTGVWVAGEGVALVDLLFFEDLVLEAVGKLVGRFGDSVTGESVMGVLEGRLLGLDDGEPGVTVVDAVMVI